MISASHNPYEDNGIKFFSARGEKLPDAWERGVEAALGPAADGSAPRSSARARRIDDAAAATSSSARARSATIFSLEGVSRSSSSAANGAAYHVAPEVFHELGAAVG